MSKSAVLLLMAVLASPLLAQQQLPPSGETIDVSLVNVDVFVTDRKGQRVTGLTADDFEIRENDRIQPITNFAEYTNKATATATAPPNAKRTVVVFVERFTLPSFRTRPLFASIRKTLRSVIRPGDSAAIVFWDYGSAYTLQNFTDDIPSLEAALTEIERQSSGVAGAAALSRRRAFARAFQGSMPSDRIETRNDSGSIDSWGAHAEAQFALFHFEHKVEELKALMRSIADVDGRKIVIFATNDFGLYPAGSVDGHAPENNLRTDRYRDAIARTANEHGITIYPVYPVGLEWTPAASAVENRVDIYSPNPRQDAYRAARDQQALVNQTAALAELAKETGGLMAAGSSDIVSLLPRVVEDLHSYYSLAYRTPATGTTRSRDIAVKAKNREYTVRTRREYVEKTDVTRMQDRVVANLYRPDGGGSIPVYVGLGKIEKLSRTRWSVPVLVNLPLDALSIGPDGRGSFSVFIATGGMIGIMSDVQQRTQHFSKADLSPGQQHVTYELTLTFNAATSVVSVGVMDAGSKDFGLKTVDLPLFRAEETRLGGE
ncbi:MAG TPA: VWA domain-containing protein [Thermoanaerobaculia bacterium]|nr:VWA domain-containing protein [Thermoanaerobaculia bacterium]